MEMTEDENQQRFLCKGIELGCAKTFKTPSGRSKHHNKCVLAKRIKKKKEYTKLPDGTFKCLICGVILTDEGNTYRHINNKHKKPKRPKIKKKYICSVCSKHLPSKAHRKP